MGSCPYSPFLGAGGITEISNVDTLTPIENVSSLCTPDSATLTAPSIATTQNNSLVLLAYGIVGSNDLTEPAGFSLVYTHDIGGLGVDMANFVSSVYPTSGTDTGDQNLNREDTREQPRLPDWLVATAPLSESEAKPNRECA